MSRAHDAVNASAVARRARVEHAADVAAAHLVDLRLAERLRSALESYRFAVDAALVVDSNDDKIPC
jgi:hypothetical protein